MTIAAIHMVHNDTDSFFLLLVIHTIRCLHQLLFIQHIKMGRWKVKRIPESFPNVMHLFMVKVNKQGSNIGQNRLTESDHLAV